MATPEIVAEPLFKVKLTLEIATEPAEAVHGGVGTEGVPPSNKAMSAMLVALL